MKQSNPKKAASKARTPSPKPLQKRQVSFGVILKRLTFNLNRRHKISAALIGVMVIVIVIVSFSFLPQNARSKTFTFFQTAWSSISATAVHNPDGSDQTAITTYVSKDAQ